MLLNGTQFLTEELNPNKQDKHCLGKSLRKYSIEQCHTAINTKIKGISPKNSPESQTK